MNAEGMDQSWQVPKMEQHRFLPKRNKYCLVIPVINEGEKIRKQLKQIQALPFAQQIDIIIADGGSTDDSLNPDFLTEVGVSVLLIKRDTGKLSAQLRMAYAFALTEGYDGIVTMDGNNKDSVESIADFMTALDEGYDFIQGSRFIANGVEENTPVERLFAIQFIHAPLISLMAGFQFTDTTNGFRGYSRALLLHPKVQPFRALFETYDLIFYLSVRAPRVGLKTKEIPVSRRYPQSGPTPTKITFSVYFVILNILLKLFYGYYTPICGRIKLPNQQPQANFDSTSQDDPVKCA